jgi:uncharacterized membrane protein
VVSFARGGMSANTSGMDLGAQSWTVEETGTCSSFDLVANRRLAAKPTYALMRMRMRTVT